MSEVIDSNENNTPEFNDFVSITVPTTDQQHIFNNSVQDVSFSNQHAVDDHTNELAASTAVPTGTSFSYRDNPAIDESTSMAFNMNVRSDPTAGGDENTSFIASSCDDITPALSEADRLDWANILSTSEKMHINDSDFNSDPPFTMKGDYESPLKMSRVDSAHAASLDIDKLLTEEPSSVNFKFQKFGTNINDSTHSNIPISDSFSNETSKFGHNSNFSQIDGIHDVETTCNDFPLNSILDIPGEQHSPDIENIIPSLPKKLPHQSGTTYRKLPDPTRQLRSQSLAQSFPDRYHNITLKIIKQPEAQHRARYLTEGSRGAIKDSLQQGHPIVQLVGYNELTYLEIFIGTDSGKVRPHSFYQACRISGKNASASKEREIDGTVVIEMELEPTKKMTAIIDCVGILKLRNTDVEKRVGTLKTKKKSTKCRMIFRANMLQADGTVITLQTASVPITCTQPAGLPEMNRMSLNSAPATGGPQLFVIGKNFVRGFRVKFVEVDKLTSQVTWEYEAEVDQECVNQTHFICTVPQYKSIDIRNTVQVQIVVETSSGTSDSCTFTYQPDDVLMSNHLFSTPQSCHQPVTTVPTHTSSTVNTNSLDTSHGSSNVAIDHNSIVSPEALDLVAQIQQQRAESVELKMFRIPEGVNFISKESHSLPSSEFTSSVLGEPGVNNMLLASIPDLQDS